MSCEHDIVFLTHSLILTNSDGDGMCRQSLWYALRGAADAIARLAVRHAYLAPAPRLLNKCMETNAFLDHLYAQLKALGLVANQYDFSLLCGRTPAWLSTLKARRLPMTTDAALMLSLSIRRMAATMLDAAQHDAAVALSDAVLAHAHARAERRLAGLECVR